MISAFGPNAQRYGAALAGLDAVIADRDRTTDAYLEAVRRRELGRPFYGMVLLDEPRTRTLELAAPAVLAKWPGFDERRAAFDHLGSGDALLNGRPSRDVFADIDPNFRQGVAEFFLLADAVLVRSHAEYARVNAFCPRPRPFERVVAVPVIAAPVRRAPGRPSLVVWATGVPAEACALYAFALSEFHGDVTFVVGPGTPPAGLPGTYVHEGDPRVAAALATATAVVATDAVDPGAAVAFARLGYGVAAPESSGAHEYVRDVVWYDPGIPRTLQVAASIAVAQPASLRELPAAPPPAPAIPPIPRASEELPLVSIVIATYNRRDDLDRCLGCLAAQTYPNLEAVVVNDAGVPIDDIVARYPFARLHDLPENVGNMRAVAAGVRLTRGDFIASVADDDWYYPDFVTRVAGALIRSGASIAHANGLIRHEKRLPDRTLETIGLNAGVFIDTTTPSDSLVASPVVLPSVLFRRSTFDVIEPQIDIILSDHEIQLRAAEHFVFAYVDHTAVEWRLRGESYYAGMDSVAGMREVYALHPRPDRPMVERKRAEALENVAARPRGTHMFPPTIHVSRPAETG
jgi:hypothetical protein